MFQTGIQVYSYEVGFEVLTEVVMKCSVFWDITPCSPLKVKQLFGGTYHLHLQGRRISFFDHEDGEGDVPPKPRLTLTDYMPLYPGR
jgi:hypothetical protein